MEGFTGNKNVKPYELLSYYYDWLLVDKDSFNYWLDYIEMEPFSSCLELASGSGVLAGMLKEKGHSIIASDISNEMKEISKKNFDGEYRILDMTNYHLQKKFDCIICFVDSINYLKKEELDAFFSCAYEHLNPGGRLLFDSHHKKRLNEFSSQYIEEGHLFDGVPYQWTISADVENKEIMEHFTFYKDDVMIQEHHLQYVFDKEMLKEKMEKHNFKVEIIEQFIEDEKMLFIGRKL